MGNDRQGVAGGVIGRSNDSLWRSRLIAGRVAYVCPDCGEGMRRDARNIRVLECVSCGNTQSIDVLGPTAATRQQSHLHARGMDRLRDALRD